jgi:hypothetical protein
MDTLTEEKGLMRKVSKEALEMEKNLMICSNKCDPSSIKVA